MSGGHPGNGVRGGISEAAAMARYAETLVDRGSNASSYWLLEENSTSTRENAIYSFKLLQRHGCASPSPPSLPGTRAHTHYPFYRSIPLN